MIQLYKSSLKSVSVPILYWETVESSMLIPFVCRTELVCPSFTPFCLSSRFPFLRMSLVAKKGSY